LKRKKTARAASRHGTDGSGKVERNGRRPVGGAPSKRGDRPKVVELGGESAQKGGKKSFRENTLGGDTRA